jgi:hypothetical protein
MSSRRSAYVAVGAVVKSAQAVDPSTDKAINSAYSASSSLGTTRGTTGPAIASESEGGLQGLQASMLLERRGPTASLMQAPCKLEPMQRMLEMTSSRDPKQRLTSVWGPVMKSFLMARIRNNTFEYTVVFFFPEFGWECRTLYDESLGSHGKRQGKRQGKKASAKATSRLRQGSVKADSKATPEATPRQRQGNRQRKATSRQRCCATRHAKARHVPKTKFQLYVRFRPPCTLMTSSRVGMATVILLVSRGFTPE